MRLHQTTTSNADISRGFTLVELLVSISIIGVLISLLLPAVQSAREAARRLHCINNIRQLAIGTQNYESSEGSLPPSATLDTAESFYAPEYYPVVDQHAGKQFSWAVHLLPYIEQQNLYAQIDQNKNIFEQDANPQSQIVETFLCPSDEARGRLFYDEDLSQGKHFAKANYAAYVSPYHIDMQIMFPGALIATGHTLQEIEDGTSNTIVFSELRTLGHSQDERGVWALPWAGSSILSFDMHHQCASAEVKFCPFDGFYRANPISEGQTQTPNSHTNTVDTLHYCLDGSQQQLDSDFEGMPCKKWNGRFGYYGFYSASPRSLHPGGVNVSYLDGHTSFVADNVDEYAFAYRVSINDGQADSYDF